MLDENTNWENWSELVLSWVDGSTKHPETIDELNAQMQEAKVGSDFSQLPFRGVNVVQAVDGVLQIALPCKEAVERKVHALSQGQAYELPTFYIDLTGVTFAVSEANKIKFLKHRISEYVIGQCA